MRDILAIDIGSRSVKIGVIRENVEPTFDIYDTVLFFSDFGSPSSSGFRLNLDRIGVREDVLVRATGYGRNAINIAGAEVVPEIQAHASGAVVQTGLDDFTLIDLGGQDSKIIYVVDGRVEDFYMNDRCAASTGRYIENMASILGMSLEEISRYSENPEKLSATCAVFGESELVAKIAKGVDKHSLAAGVNMQIVKKIAPKIESHPPKRIVLVGGVALNRAISRIFAKRYSVPVIIPKLPQFNAVIGLLKPTRRSSLN